MTKTNDFAARVITALARHERAAGELGAIKKAIGAELEKCPITIRAMSNVTGFNDPVLFREIEKLWDGSRVMHHLHNVLAITIDNDNGYHGQRKLDADEIREELTGDPEWPNESSYACPHCLAAWDLIIKRKEVRHELGNAKRALRQLGKTAMRVTA